jgi:tripartite-type tricarboxylate transporter receptor subunit TctC
MSLRRSLLSVAMMLTGASLISPMALAQAPAAWPSKPIRVIVTFPPGGSSDASMRLLAPKLAERLGQNVVIENRAGAGGGVGLEAAAKSPPDGHTLVLAAAGGLTANPSLYAKLNYDPVKDFAPIMAFSTSPLVLVAGSAVPAGNLRDVIRIAKSKPGSLSYASGGNGTAMHLSGELLKSMAGLFIVHVPYRGSGPAVMAALSGDVELAVADITSVQPHLRSGKLKALGVLGAQRSQLAPEIPTLAEAGVPGYDAAGWFALLAPAGTPPAVVSRLNSVINELLATPELRRQFANVGLEPLGGSSDDLARLMRSETEKWAKVIKVSGAKVD